MRFKTFMEAKKEYRWATVKNIKPGTEAKYIHDNLDGSPQKYGSFIFDYHLSETVGKHYKFKTDPEYPTLLVSVDTGYYYHPDWLEIENEGEPIPLFPKD